MNTSTIGVLFSLAWFVFAVPTAVFLLKAYGRSKMSGFLWLLVAVVVWPFCARLLTLGMGVMAAEAHLGVSSMLAVNLGETVIGAALLLTAVVILDRELGRRIVAAAPPSAVPPTDLR